MLLRFEVSNHRSIMEPVELSMIAADSDRPATRSFDKLDEKVLAVAGIYGPNASGKSNVLEALAWLCNAVGQSFRTWDADVPRDPFRFGAGPTTPSTYEVDLMVEGVRYGYRLEVDSEQVLYESLHYYPHKRKNTLFEREGRGFTPGRDLTAAKGIGDLVSPRTLVLSSAMRLDHPIVALFGRALTSTKLVRWSREPANVAPLLSQDVSMASWLEETQSSVFEALDRGQLLLFDNFGSSLHPALSAWLVEHFQSPTTNPNGAQLIFTSHDPSLLNHLNRDEVWFTDKFEGAATTLIALAEYKLRKGMNLERAYLQGRFGSLPDLEASIR